MVSWFQEGKSPSWKEVAVMVARKLRLHILLLTHRSQSKLGMVQGFESSKPTSVTSSKEAKPPRQRHLLGTKPSNAQDYRGHPQTGSYQFYNFSKKCVCARMCARVHMCTHMHTQHLGKPEQNIWYLPLVLSALLT